MSNDMSRRSFLKKGTAMAAGLAVAPGIIIAGETPKDNKKKLPADSFRHSSILTGDQMVVVHPDPLQVGVDDRRAHEGEPPLLQVLADLFR